MQSLRTQNHSAQKGARFSTIPSYIEDKNSISQPNSAPHFHKELPVTILITDKENHDATALFPKESLMFCYEAVIRTIDACTQGKYSDFDAHTTTNCCHGMAMFAKDLIVSVTQLDLKKLRIEGCKIKENLAVSPANNQYACAWVVPKPLVKLAGLYLLAFIKEINQLTGGRTSTIKLKNISYISTNLCNKVAHSLKKGFANLVANRYRILLEELPSEMSITGAAINVWGKYIQPKYLREDRYGLLYASSLFSMQVCVAHLISSRSKVALINDLISCDGLFKGRYILMLQGDGDSRLDPLTSEQLKLLKLFHQDEPIVIIGGCVYSDALDLKSLTMQMNAWVYQIPTLILACEVFYPQFPRVAKDPNFDSSPIVPQETLLKRLLEKLSSTRGVSAEDPSLFCSTHIYPASVRQVLELDANKNALPVSFIPGKLMKNPAVGEGSNVSDEQRIFS